MTDLVKVLAHGLIEGYQFNADEDYVGIARVALKYLEKKGYRVVPVEPDIGMRQACTFEQVEVDWPALLAAAPKITTGG